MLRLRRSPPLIALLTGVLFATSPPHAAADFELQIYEGSTLVSTQTTGGNSLSFTLSDSNFMFSGGVAFTNNPGNFLNSNLQISTLSVRNLGSGQGSISFVLSANNFTMPVGPLDTMGSTISSSSTNSLGGTDSLAFQSYVDTNNNLFGATSPAGLGLVASNGASSTGLQTLDVTSGTLTSGGTNTVSSVVNKGSSYYSLTNVTTLTISAGAQVGAAGTTALSSSSGTVPVPAPGALALACTGLPLLLWGSRRRWRPQA